MYTLFSRRSRWFNGLALLPILSLAGCGGGGSNGASDTRQPPLTGGAYTLIDLGTIGDSATPVRINAQNQVLGAISRKATVEPLYNVPGGPINTRGYTGVFLYRPGTTLANGTLQDITPEEFRSVKRYITPTGFSPDGQAVGVAWTVTEDPINPFSPATPAASFWNAALGNAASVTTLPLNDGTVPADAVDISSSGYILGRDAGGNAFRYKDGAYLEPSTNALANSLGSYQNQLQLVSVNDNGDAVGTFTFAESEYTRSKYRTVLLRGNTLTDLGVPGGMTSFIAYRITPDGAVLGRAIKEEPYGPLAPTESQVYLWRDGVFTTVTPLSGYGFLYPTGINSTHEVVGNVVGNYSMVTPGGLTPVPTTSFISRAGTTLDLNTQIKPNSGWLITGVADINDAGIICGTATFHNGNPHVVLLVPE